MLQKLLGSSSTWKWQKTPKDSLTKEIVTHRPPPPLHGHLRQVSSKEAETYLSKAAHHLLHQGAHRSYVDDLEVIHIDRAIHVDVFPYLSQHTHQGHIGLPSTLEAGRSETRSAHLLMAIALTSMG